jgi:hypothetical protein
MPSSLSEKKHMFMKIETNLKTNEKNLIRFSKILIEKHFPLKSQN